MRKERILKITLFSNLDSCVCVITTNTKLNIRTWTMLEILEFPYGTNFVTSALDIV